MLVRKNVLFRADGNSEIGLGHLYRLLALAKMLQGKYECVFLTKHPSTLNSISQSFKVALIPHEVESLDEPDWIKNKFSKDHYFIIIDGYQFNYSYLILLKKSGFFIIYIDDLVKERMCADLVINHSPVVKKQSYTHEYYTQFALGTKYALLRPSFLKAASQEKSVQKINNVLVCFGGADPENLTQRAVKALTEIDTIKEIFVILGASYRHTICFESKSKKIHVFQNLEEEQLLEIFNSSNLAIAPASTILYELCAVKMPIITGYYTDNQKMLYKGIVDRNAALGAGHLRNFTTDDFKKYILKIISKNNIGIYLAHQANLFDANIKSRILIKIEKELMLYTFSIRLASKKDIDLIFNWSNEEQVRTQSFNSESIAYNSHCKWFDKKLKDINSLLYIVEIDHKSAGFVRFEIKNESAEIGISIDKNFRGKGLSSLFIEKATREYFAKNKYPIFAYIKKSNIVSIKSFQNAGFSFYRRKTIKETESIVYKLVK